MQKQMEEGISESIASRAEINQGMNPQDYQQAVIAGLTGAGAGPNVVSNSIKGVPSYTMQKEYSQMPMMRSIPMIRQELAPIQRQPTVGEILGIKPGSVPGI